MSGKCPFLSPLAVALAVSMAPVAVVADCGDGGLCACNEELARAVRGEPVNRDRIAGGLGAAPRDAFGPGSQNIPVVCRAAQYFTDHDPHWFNEYLGIQSRPEPPGFLGTEVLSPLYMPSVLGAIIAVRARAEERGQGSLVANADGWLRAVWALMALATVDDRIAGGTIRHANRNEPVEAHPGYTAGVTVVAAGSRADAQGSVGLFTLLHPFMSLALDWKPRQYLWDVRASPGFYGGLHVALLSLGFEIGENGRVRLDGLSPPPRHLGLSPAEQKTLRRFVASRGQEGLTAVVGLVGERRPSCDLTFLRTTEGVTTWFGTSESAQRICNRNKGPLLAARFDYETRQATWLHPNVATNPAEGGESYRTGGRVCGRLDDGVERCLAIVGGDLVYEVAWTRRDGMRIVRSSSTARRLRETMTRGE